MTPEIIAALQAWWDETPGAFTRGTTSAVIADMMEETGFDPNQWDAPHLFDWMRNAREGAILMHQIAEESIKDRTGIFHVSAGTQANPCIRHMVNWFGERLRILGVAPSDMAREATTLISARECAIMGRSLEFREYYRFGIGALHDLSYAINTRDPVALFGFAPLSYGMHFKLNDVQPEGQIDCWCGDICITARVY